MLLRPVDQVEIFFNDQVVMLLEFNKFNVMYSASYSLVHFVPKNKRYRSHLVRFMLEDNNYRSHLSILRQHTN